MFFKLFIINQATSRLEEFDSSNKFRTVIGETFPEELDSADKVRRVIMCSG